MQTSNLELANRILDYYNLDYNLVAARQGGLIVPYVREIAIRKNLTIFEGCHFPRFCIIHLTESPENRDK